jgi:hypothetical protein
MQFSVILLAVLAAMTAAQPTRNGQGQGQGQGHRQGQSQGQNQGQGQAAASASAAQAASTDVSAPGAGSTNTATAAAAAKASSTAAAATNTGANNTGAFDASLVPEFGIQAGQQPDGTGNCIGDKGKKIPCDCPPNRNTFVQKVAAAAAAGNSAGVPIKFPTDNSSASKKQRIGASIIVLQNLQSKGVGCPAAATTFLEQQAAA